MTPNSPSQSRVPLPAVSDTVDPFSAVVGARRGLGMPPEPRSPEQPPRPIESLADFKRRVSRRAWVEVQFLNAAGELIQTHRGRASPYTVPERSEWSLEYDNRTSRGHIARVFKWPRLARHCEFNGATLSLRYRSGKVFVFRILDDEPRHETAAQHKRIEEGWRFPASLEEARAEHRVGVAFRRRAPALHRPLLPDDQA